MNISSETNLLVNNIVNAVRNLENFKAKAGDESSASIRSVCEQLRQNKVPEVEVCLSAYVEELGYNIDFWVKWDGKIFLTSSDDPDDFQPILGQTIEQRVHFVKILPLVLRDIESSFLDKINNFNIFLDDEELVDVDDLIPEEMSEEDKDFMMMNGIED
jgi:hypothetical protein